MGEATIHDVARRAGVSHMTVSRFLAGFEGIRPETRTRVEAAVAELDYRPNAAARALRTRQSRRIGMLAERLDQLGPARVTASAVATARRHGYLVDVVLTGDDDEETVDAAIELMSEHRVVGLLVTAQREEVIARIRRGAPTAPLVVDGDGAANPDGRFAPERVGALAAAHLADLGHRRVGYVAGPAAWPAAVGRLAGFEAELRRAGGELAWVREGDWSAPSGAHAWRTLRAGERGVTAVAAANDSMAMGLLAAAADDGVAVPADLSVIGTDDIQEAAYLRPSLSTIAIDFEGEGRALMERLLAGMATDVEPVTPAPPRLVARASTAPIPA